MKLAVALVLAAVVAHAEPAKAPRIDGHWHENQDKTYLYVDSDTNVSIDRSGHGGELDLRVGGSYTLIAQTVTNRVSCTRSDYEKHDGTWTLASSKLVLKAAKVRTRVIDNCDPRKNSDTTRDVKREAIYTIAHRTDDGGIEHLTLHNADGTVYGRPYSLFRQ